MARQGMGSYGVLATNVPDKLIAGAAVPVLTDGVNIASGQGILKRGSVIGIITVSGKGKLCDSESEDGSEAAKFILAEDEIDTTAADVMATVYKTGEFNRKALVFGANGAPDTLDVELRGVGIHLVGEMPY